MNKHLLNGIQYFKKNVKGFQHNVLKIKIFIACDIIIIFKGNTLIFILYVTGV